MNRYCIGVDVGGTNIKLGLVDPKGHVIARTSFATKAFSSSRLKLISEIARQIKEMIKASGMGIKDFAGVGVGLPGLVDADKGIVRFLPNIPGWRNVPLTKILQGKLKLPVYIDNDVKLITLAEWKFGAGRGVSNLICMTLGTGVGSGLILNNKLFRGESNAAGELGHMPLNEEGPRCNCGGYGCFEAYIGNSRLVMRANAVMRRKDMSLEQMFQLAKSGDPRALLFWKKTAEHLGNGLVGVVNLLNPRLIIIGGGVANNDAFLFKAAEVIIKKRAMSTQSSMVKIVRAKLGNDAGIIGAQVLVKNAQ